MSFPPLLAIVGSALSSILLNFLGRKNSILLSGFIFFSSFLMIGLADFTGSRDGLVLAGRAISGLGVGLGVPSTSIYIAETSSPDLRGKLSSLPALFLAFGVLLGYLLGMETTSTSVRLSSARQYFYQEYSWPGTSWPWPAVPLESSSSPSSSCRSLPPPWLRRGRLTRPPEPCPCWPDSTLTRPCKPPARHLQSHFVLDICSSRGVSEMRASGKLSSGDVKIRSRQEVVRQLFSVSTLHPLGLSLLLHFAQNWCGVNVIVFKEIFSSCPPFYSISFYIYFNKLDIDLNLPSLPDRECVRDGGEQCGPVHLHLHCRSGPAGGHWE